MNVSRGQICPLNPQTDHVLAHVTSEKCYACTTPKAHQANFFLASIEKRQVIYYLYLVRLFTLLVKLLDDTSFYFLSSCSDAH